MLGRDEQHRLGRSDLRLETDDALRQLAFEVLVIEGQVVDRDEMERQPAFSQPRQRLRELAVDGVAAIAADDDGDLDLCHDRPTLVTV